MYNYSPGPHISSYKSQGSTVPVVSLDRDRNASITAYLASSALREQNSSTEEEAKETRETNTEAE